MFLDPSQRLGLKLNKLAKEIKAANIKLTKNGLEVSRLASPQQLAVSEGGDFFYQSFLWLTPRNN